MKKKIDLNKLNKKVNKIKYIEIEKIDIIAFFWTILGIIAIIANFALAYIITEMEKKWLFIIPTITAILILKLLGFYLDKKEGTIKERYELKEE